MLAMHLLFLYQDCAFANYMNMFNITKAIEATKTKPDYMNLRVVHWKDRYINPPKLGPPGKQNEEDHKW